jgi:hypothetical protein
MPSSSPDFEIRYENPTTFAKQVKNLNPNHRAVLIMALEHILGRYGLKLAKSPWLRYLGSSLWEFRVGPSSKAIESKAEAPFDDIVPFTKVLIRIFCSFQNNQIVIHGCYDKSRFGSGKRQNEAIQKARDSLLTFKQGE